MASLKILGLVILAVTAVSCYPDTAGTEACASMIPGHGSDSSEAVPAIISTSATTYTNAQEISVRITGKFTGILLQARTVGSTHPKGSWKKPSVAGLQTLKCKASDDSVCHSNENQQNDVTLTWVAPADCNPGDIQFEAVICRGEMTWWGGQKSTSIIKASSEMVVTTQCAGAGGLVASCACVLLALLVQGV